MERGDLSPSIKDTTNAGGHLWRWHKSEQTRRAKGCSVLTGRWGLNQHKCPWPFLPLPWNAPSYLLSLSLPCKDQLNPLSALSPPSCRVAWKVGTWTCADLSPRGVALGCFMIPAGWCKAKCNLSTPSSSSPLLTDEFALIVYNQSTGWNKREQGKTLKHDSRMCSRALEECQWHG